MARKLRVVLNSPEIGTSISFIGDNLNVGMLEDSTLVIDNYEVDGNKLGEAAFTKGKWIAYFLEVDRESQK